MHSEKTIPFTIVSKSIIYPAVNFDKGGERLVHWKLKVSDKKKLKKNIVNETKKYC